MEHEAHVALPVALLGLGDTQRNQLPWHRVLGPGTVSSGPAPGPSPDAVLTSYLFIPGNSGAVSFLAKDFSESLLKCERRHLENTS